MEPGLPAFARFLERLFGEHCRVADKPRWINKTPAYVHLLPVLDRLFPDQRFVHCVRDGRDVAASVVTRPWGPKTHLQGGEWWARKVLDGVRWGQAHPERYLEVRYEDLLVDPEPTLRRVSSFLGVADESGAIAARYTGDGTRLDPSRAGGWTTTFTSAEIAAFEGRHATLLEHLGYPRREVSAA